MDNKNVVYLFDTGKTESFVADWMDAPTITQHLKITLRSKVDEDKRYPNPKGNPISCLFVKNGFIVGQLNITELP